jgi:hypothetical protein
MAQITLNKVRLAFPNLFEPKSINGGASRYGATLIIEPGSANAKAVIKAMQEAAKAKWGDKGEATYKKLVADKRVCYRTEERTNKEGDVYDGFEGMHSLNASNKVRPLVIDRDKSPLTADDGKPYGGCYVNVMIDIWAQDNKDPTIGRRLNATLMGVQFAADGDSFGSSNVATVDAFQTLEATAEDIV